MDNNIITATDSNVGIITIEKPINMNSLSHSMMQSIAQQIIDWEKSGEIRVIILQGIDKAFVSGIDMKELVDVANLSFEKFQEMQQSIETIAKCKIPVIAAISGLALGVGFEIALACDFIIASESVVFANPETSLSFLPSFGGIQRLVNVVGKAKASEMIFSGRAMKADEAYMSGVISRIVPLANLKTDALLTAKRIAEFSPETIKLAKKNILSACNSSDVALSLQNVSAIKCFLEDDFKQSLINLQKKTKKA